MNNIGFRSTYSASNRGLKLPDYGKVSNVSGAMSFSHRIGLPKVAEPSEKLSLWPTSKDKKSFPGSVANFSVSQRRLKLAAPLLNEFDFPLRLRVKPAVGFMMEEVSLAELE